MLILRCDTKFGIIVIIIIIIIIIIIHKYRKLLHFEINILNILNIFTEIIGMAPPINVQDGMATAIPAR